MNRKIFIRVCLLTAIVTVISMTIPAQSATVAYWRFEAGPAGANVVHGAGTGIYAPDIADYSGNGYELSVWETGGNAGYAYRSAVASAQVTHTGATNNFSVKNTGGGPAMWTAPADPISSMTPAQWTIEATFKLENGGYRCIIGRDSRGAATKGNNTDQALSALYFQAIPNNGLAIKFCDVNGYWHEAISANNAFQSFDYPSNNDGVGVPWYSMAAVSNGTMLRLYLFNHNNPGAGYVLIAETNMTTANPGSTNTALTAGAGSAGDWMHGCFTVGRGLFNGGHTDRAYGFIDEVRFSDTALPVSQLLASPGYILPTSPAADEYLMSTAAITYSWTSAIPAEVMFNHYDIYIANSTADLAPAVPTTTLHSAVIANEAATSYAGYTGTYAYGEDYYWRIDMTAMDPNNADPNNIVYNIPVLYQGAPVRFFGPRACPAVSISGNVSNMPDPITHAYVPQNAVFTAGITRGTVGVDAITWYKVVGVQDSLTTVDPNDTADTVVSNVAGVTEIAFIPNLATATSTTLTIVGAAPSDNGDYYARVRLVDPLGGGTGCSGNSPTANLYVRDDTNAGTDYLVHRYQFNGNANDSIGTAHGTVVDLNDPNHAFVGGQIQLFNGALSSQPMTPVVFPAPTPQDPNATITRQQLLAQPGAYVDLPNGTISALGKSATFMVWFTYTSADSGNWPRLFDFGTSTGGEGFSTGGDGVLTIAGVPYLDTTSADTQEYIMVSPKRDAGPGWRFESIVRPPSTSYLTDMASNTAIAGGVEACVACVFDAANGVQTVYVNGVQVGQTTGLVNDLSKLSDVNNWLGRSQWNDAMFSGKINEFRIYDIPLSGYWVKAYSDQGPDNITKPNPCIQSAPNPMDFNTDCEVNILDFAAFAQQWLSCDKLFGCN